MCNYGKFDYHERQLGGRWECFGAMLRHTKGSPSVWTEEVTEEAKNAGRKEEEGRTAWDLFDHVVKALERVGLRASMSPCRREMEKRRAAAGGKQQQQQQQQVGDLQIKLMMCRELRELVLGAVGGKSEAEAEGVGRNEDGKEGGTEGGKEGGKEGEMEGGAARAIEKTTDPTQAAISPPLHATTISVSGVTIAELELEHAAQGLAVRSLKDSLKRRIFQGGRGGASTSKAEVEEAVWYLLSIKKKIATLEPTHKVRDVRTAGEV
jgi:hypothetical protein